MAGPGVTLRGEVDLVRTGRPGGRQGKTVTHACTDLLPRRLNCRLARWGESRPITASRRHATDPTAGVKGPGPRPAPGRRIVAGCRARIGGTARQPPGNGEAEPAVAFPFCSAECSPRPAGIVASMSEPAGRVSTRPAGRGWSEGTGASRRCGRGRFFGDFLVATRKSLARRGETRPITANRKHPKTKGQRSKALDPGLRRGDESLPTALPATKAPPPAGNGEAGPAVVFPF